MKTVKDILIEYEVLIAAHRGCSGGNIISVAPYGTCLSEEYTRGIMRGGIKE